MRCGRSTNLALWGTNATIEDAAPFTFVANVALGATNVSSVVGRLTFM